MGKKKVYQWCVLFMGATMLLSSAGSVEAKINVQPKIEVGSKNNSNFWKAEDEEVSVNTYWAQPGIEFGLETDRTEIMVDATVDFFWYDDQDTPPAGIGDASDDDYVGFTGEASINYQLTDRLNIGLTDDLYVTRDPARADAFNNSINRDKYTINYFEPNAYYEIADKFGILVKYRNTFTDYENDLEDSSENRGILDFYYHLNSRSSIYLDYQIWARDYDQDTTDYTSNVVSLNYEREFNYLTIKAGAGYHDRSFDEDVVDDIGMFSWNIELRGQDPDSTRKTTRSWFELDLGQELNDDGTGNSYFKASYIGLEVGYRFMDRLAVSLNGEFQNSEYETDERDEDTYLVGAQVEYQVLDFMTVGLEGGIEDRDSNVDGNSYEDRFVLATLNVDYDLGSR